MLRSLFEQLRGDPYEDGVRKFHFYPSQSAEPELLLADERFRITYRLVPALGFSNEERVNIEILGISRVVD